MNDYWLRQAVLDELDFEPRVNATRIGVGVYAGVVTLSGFVSSYGEKLAAERAVRKVKGVRAIAEEIEVRLPSRHMMADDEIARRAADLLRWRVAIPADRIAVKVEKGVVTLEGEVERRDQKTAVADALHNLRGIVGIVNLIRIRSPVGASEVKEKIEQALRRRAELDASRITVRTEDDTVILDGKVHSWFERGIAEQAAWSAPGVTEVKDHIEIEA